MKLRDFPMLTDENIDPDVVQGLRELGFDVLDVVEVNLVGSTDLEILRYATSRNRIVVTHDSDFGTLAILQHDSILGLLYLRPGHVDPAFTLETIVALSKADIELTSPFVLVAKRRGNRVTIRVRALEQRFK